jgi:hypothetical protein
MVDPEIEIAAAGSLVGLGGWRVRHPAKIGSPCANCGAPLAGPYCHACGQLAESFERSIWSLLKEAVENFFDADGRILHTLPRLMFRPASLTKAYLAGRRASQTPPLRLFLVIVVMVFFVGGLTPGAHRPINFYRGDSPGHSTVDLAVSSDPQVRPFIEWLRPRLNYAINHQQEFASAVESWFHRIAIMFLPVATLLLSFLFIFRRRFFIFDHAIFSMHSLSFMGLLFTVGSLMGMAPPLRGLVGLLDFVAPTHLFFHMRGVYGTSVFGTLLRMFVLFILSAIALALLVAAAVFVELNAVGAGS